MLLNKLHSLTIIKSKKVLNMGEKFSSISFFSNFLICAFLICPCLNAQENDFNKLINLSLDELLKVEVITAGKKAEKVKDIPASVTVITRDEIKHFGYKNLDELLSHITGLYIFDSYHPMGKVTVGIRGYTTPGGGNDNIIILVNGVNQVEGVYDQYLLPKIALSVELIDRIEIIKGPMSVIYGNGAFFGAINIITNSPDIASKSFIQTGVGSNNTVNLSLKTQYFEPDYGIVFNASNNSTDGIDKSFSEMMSQPGKLKQFGLLENALTKNLLVDNRSFFNLSGYFKKFKFDLSYSVYKKGGLLNQPAVEESSIKMQSANAMISFNHNFSDKLFFTSKASFLNSFSEAYYSLNEKKSFITFGYNANAIEAETNLFYNYSENFSAMIGLSHRNVFYIKNPFEGESAWGGTYANSITQLSNNSAVKTNSLFFQTDFSPSKNIKIVAGLRLEQMMKYSFEASGGSTKISTGRYYMQDEYDNDDIHFIPRVALIINPFENHYFKVLYGEALRHAPLGQQADNIINTQKYGFPLLKPARIHTFELNYIAEISQHIFINFSLFRNELKDLITQKNFNISASEIGVFSTNGGEITTNGIETSIKITPSNNIELNFGGVYQKSKNKTTGYSEMAVPYSPDLMANMSLLYKFNENISFSIFGNYVDKMEADYSLEKKRFGEKVDSYFNLNTNLYIKNFIYNDLYCNFRISNLLNTQIHYPVTSTSSFADKGILAPGREFFFSLGFNF